jgi:two-component system response regulator
LRTIAILPGKLSASAEFYPYGYCHLQDKAHTLQILKKTNLANEVIVVRNGVEGLDYPIGTGAFADRETDMTPQVVHLNLKLPGLDGLGLLRLIRGDERAKFLPAAIFTSSIEERDQTDGYGAGANSYVSEAVDFDQFVDVGGLPPIGCCRMNLHQPGERRWVYLSEF